MIEIAYVEATDLHVMLSDSSSSSGSGIRESHIRTIHMLKRPSFEGASSPVDFLLQQDNAAVYTSIYLKRRFEDMNVKLLPWSARSSDWNLIGNGWSLISSRWKTVCK